MALPQRKFSADSVAGSILAAGDSLIGLKGGSNVRFTGAQMSEFVQEEIDLVIETGVWTPTLVFAGMGDAVFTYHAADGTYMLIHDRLFFEARIDFTPTYTTASSSLRMDSLPMPIASESPMMVLWQAGGGANFPNLPAGSTMFSARSSLVTGLINLQALGSGSGGGMTVTEITSGVRRHVQVSGYYVTS